MPAKACLDGSRANWRGKDILSVAGFISPADRWAIVQREWQAARASAGIPYFHMTDFMSRKAKPYCDWSDEKREAVISRLLDLINGHVTFGVGVAMVVDDFRRMPAEDRELCADNPYALCAAQCIGLVTKTLEDHNIEEPVSYVFESGGTGESAFIATMVKLATAEEEVRKALKLLGVQAGTKKEFAALDTADLLAWEMTQLAQKKTGDELVPLPTYMRRLTVPTPHHYLDHKGMTLWASDFTDDQRRKIRALFRADIPGLR